MPVGVQLRFGLETPNRDNLRMPRIKTIRNEKRYNRYVSAVIRRERGKQLGALYFCRETIYIEMEIYQFAKESAGTNSSINEDSQRVAGGLLTTEEVRLRVR